MNVRGRRTQAFDDRRHRHHVGLAADPDDHAVHHRERQRQGELDRHAAAALRLERYAAAEVLNIAANDVHADAAAGNVGDLFGGGESGQENQIVDLVFGEHASRLTNPWSRAFFEDALGIDARAVVADFNDDAAAAMFGGKADGAFFGLAGRRRSSGILDAVIDRVADDVGQRIAQTLDDRSVDLGVFADHFETDFLSGLRRQFADQPRHALEHRAHLLRAHRHDAVFQLAGVMDHLFEHLRRAGR